MGIMYSAAQAAADIHYHLITCPEHGYTQGLGRWGYDDYCYVESQSIVFPVKKGDRDCSSSVCNAWQLALLPTAYAWALDGATWTQNMRSVFAASGLFMVYGLDYPFSRGDVLLNERDHTAMVQWENWVSEFLISENGTIYAGQTGNQGGETAFRPYYNFPWDVLLHYNGKADTYMNDDVLYEIRDALLATHTSDAASIGDISVTSMKNRVDWIDYRVTLTLQYMERMTRKIDKLLAALSDVNEG